MDNIQEKNNYVNNHIQLNNLESTKLLTNTQINEIININNFTFFGLKEYLEKIYNINILVNNSYKSIIIKKTNWKLIWEILQSNYNYSYSWWYEINHLYNVIQKKYRWKWWGIILFILYENYLKIDNSFYLENTDKITLEYTNIVSMIELYKKVWFTIKWKKYLWYEIELEELTSEDCTNMDNIKNKYKKWWLEKKLDFTIVLEKI